jgi:hypothetical protein
MAPSPWRMLWKLLMGAPILPEVLVGDPLACLIVSLWRILCELLLGAPLLLKLLFGAPLASGAGVPPATGLSRPILVYLKELE